MANNSGSREQGLIQFVFYCLGWIALCIAFGIVAEWFVMTIWYPEEGAYHSLRLLESELSYLENTALITTGYGNHIIRNMLSNQQAFYLFVGDHLRLEQALHYLAESNLIKVAFNRFGWLVPEVYAVSTLNMINVMTLRIVIVLLSLPIFVLLMIWATGIGLTRRAIRRYQVRNESSFIFHHAKRIKLYSLVIPITVYLAWPNELSPTMTFAPFAVLYAASWMVMASKFKKAW